MNAYDSARFDDYRQRIARGEQLSAQEDAYYSRLCEQSQAEHESEGPPQWLGGDYPDL